MIWVRLAITLFLVFAAPTAAILVLIKLRTPVRQCPACGKQLPFFRTPQNVHEAFRGGWTCSQCGVALDRLGRRLVRAES
jgi:hypothetical protein